jgi:hypothetical protein
VEHLTKLHFNGRLLALPANIRLRWKLMAVACTLAYYVTATITAVKSFIVKAPGLIVAGKFVKSFIVEEGDVPFPRMECCTCPRPWRWRSASGTSPRRSEPEPGTNFTKLFYPQFTNWSNKLECMTLASLSNPVSYL